jgi:hypothetical protein
MGETTFSNKWRCRPLDVARNKHGRQSRRGLRLTSVGNFCCGCTVHGLGQNLRQLRTDIPIEYQLHSDPKLTLSGVPYNGYAPKKDASPGDCVFESEIRRPCPKV